MSSSFLPPPKMLPSGARVLITDTNIINIDKIITIARSILANNGL
jgi:hypothetical protein